MRSTMRALEEELGTALVSQLNSQDQQEVSCVQVTFIKQYKKLSLAKILNLKKNCNFFLLSSSFNRLFTKLI